MTSETKERIVAINSGIIPEGYKKTKVGIVPVEWEIVKLANIMHNEPRPVDKPNEPYIRIGIRSHAKGTFQELVENPAEVNMDTLYVVKKDDIVVNITFAWEHAIALASEEDDGKLVSHRFPTYVFDNNSPLYYKYVFCQDMFRQRLELISPGGAGRNRVLNKTDFINLEIYHPPLPEQQKIAEILSTQDKLIELQEKKIEQLKELKKAYLQKMFPKKGSKYPELRFKGFTDPWEQRKLGDMCDEFQSGKSIKSSEITDSGEYAVYGGNGFRGYTDTYNHDGDYALIGRQGALCGNMNFSSGKAYFTEHAVAVHGNADNDTLFLYYLLDLMNLGQYSGQSAQPGLAVNKIIQLKTKAPKLDEQRLISSFFKQLDSLITLHQRKSEQEKQKKKALMQLLLTGIVRTK